MKTKNSINSSKKVAPPLDYFSDYWWNLLISQITSLNIWSDLCPPLKSARDILSHNRSIVHPKTFSLFSSFPLAKQTYVGTIQIESNAWIYWIIDGSCRTSRLLNSEKYSREKWKDSQTLYRMVFRKLPCSRWKGRVEGNKRLKAQWSSAINRNLFNSISQQKMKMRILWMQRKHAGRKAKVATWKNTSSSFIIVNSMSSRAGRGEREN